ncbi:MAG: hypothetical protein CK519_03030 [Opitutia bacterium]|nr:hypothetical protein [Opitutales bacterium]MSR72483.1 hypothetical protein [Opitutales bacterium]PHX68793.1 MAG: hypothetical protein CK519_03030 [Opitutae bacterium]
MPELRLSMTAEARNVLSDLLRLIAPAAARVSVNRAQIPNLDPEIATYWAETLSAQAGEEARLLATAFASAKGEPAIIVLRNKAQALAFLRALSAVRFALKDLVLSDIPNSQLEDLEDLDDESLPSEKRHALACYSCFGLLQSSLIDQIDNESFD